MLIDGHFESSLAEKQVQHWKCRSRVTIDMLPDVALLDLFEFYMDEEQIEGWHTLVHVCRKWRCIVFGSPRRLDLRLHCNASTPVRETLNIWPLLPIIVRSNDQTMLGVDNIIAALEHNDRICAIDLLKMPVSQLENVLATLQQRFPALTRLQLGSDYEMAPVQPASFLGGSAPRLQTLILESIPFPGLPNLLLSATHLVCLSLWRIPYSGYFSPEGMTTCLSVMTRLEKLVIGFESLQCRPHQKGQRPPLPTRTLLPVLTELQFFGVGEYLDDLVAQIDTPLLDKLTITFYQLILHTPHLTQFISRTPKFKAQDVARVEFSNWDIWITLPQTFDGVLELGIPCMESDLQLSSLSQVCSSSFLQPLIPAVEHLYILEYRFSGLQWQDNIESSQWLEFFHPFTAVKALYISREFLPRIAPALQDFVGERVTEVLPALQTVFLEEILPSGPVQEAIGRFVTARQLANYPTVVSVWEREKLK